MSSVVLDKPHNKTELLVVGGKSYAFGLRWTSATSRAALEAEAKAAALAEGANFVVLQPAYNQFGIASIANAPSGFRGWFYRPHSGVAAIASEVGAATLAAFPLDDDRWLVLAIDRKGFLPDGDAIVSNEEEAKARIQTLLAQSPAIWRKKFVPASWGIADARTVYPKDLLSGSGGLRLSPLWRLIHRRRIRFGFAGFAALLAMATFAVFRFTAAPPPLAVVSFQPPKPVAAIWTPAALSLERCLSAIGDAERYNAMPGWILAKYTCANGESLAVDFNSLGNGQIDVMRSLLPQAHLSDDGRSAVLSISLSPLPRIASAGAFAAPEQYRLIGLALAQRLNGAFTIAASKKLLPGETNTVPPGQTWRLFAWTYQTQAPAVVWASAIARFGSISVDSIVFNPASNLWQIGGALYASN